MCLGVGWAHRGAHESNTVFSGSMYRSHHMNTASHLPDRSAVDVTAVCSFVGMEPPVSWAPKLNLFYTVIVGIWHHSTTIYGRGERFYLKTGNGGVMAANHSFLTSSNWRSCRAKEQLLLESSSTLMLGASPPSRIGLSAFHLAAKSLSTSCAYTVPSQGTTRQSF